jgi:hypothetical protein
MVAFKELWYRHPANEAVQYPCVAPHDLDNLQGEKIRRGFPVFGNQCSIRMGVCLQRNGVTLGQLGRLETCGVHGVDEMHIIRAADLAGALARANIAGLGRIERITGTEPAKFYPKLFGRTGIIYIQDYWLRTSDRPGEKSGDHIDVWNGYRSSTKWLMEWFSWLGYYSNYAEAKEIWFWEVK